VSSSAGRSALAALGAARAAIGRLDPTRHPDELAADLLDGWASIADALRTLVGGSTATSMDLVREARQRQQLSFDQANALAAYCAVHDRARDTAYRPSADDVEVARRAMAALDGAAGAAAALPDAVAPGAPPPLPSLESMTPDGMRHTPLGTLEPDPAARPARSSRRFWVGLLLALVVGGAAGAAYYWVGGPRRAAVMHRAMSEYEAGNLQAAAEDFRRVVLMDPGYALSHVYLARIARRAGNMAEANDELQLALTADPANAIALREMGAYLFVSGNYELARKFYVRAVSSDPEDAAAQGYLGCTLVKLGRIDEGERWITRAGPGAWTGCVSGATPPDTLH